MRPWESHLPSLSFRFLICNLVIILAQHMHYFKYGTVCKSMVSLLSPIPTITGCGGWGMWLNPCFSDLCDLVSSSEQWKSQYLTY